MSKYNKSKNRNREWRNKKTIRSAHQKTLKCASEFSQPWTRKFNEIRKDHWNNMNAQIKTKQKS